MNARMNACRRQGLAVQEPGCPGGPVLESGIRETVILAPEAVAGPGELIETGGWSQGQPRGNPGVPTGVS